MKIITPIIGFIILMLSVTEHAETKEPRTTALYFDFGNGLIEEFKGTYEFKYKKVEFIRSGPSNYIIKSSGDQSPSTNQLHIRNDFTYWTLTWSKENWFVIKNTMEKGDYWENSLRGWKQTYQVVGTNLTLETPAGNFSNCVKLKISWIAHEHDMEGLQEKILYLAPHMGIVRQEHYDNGDKWHEEVLTNYKKIGD